MQSYSDGKIQYKSSLELQSFIYCDINPKVTLWSVEPFAIQYIKPTDGQQHRYYPDLWIKMVGGEFLVEVKSYNETIPPKVNDKRYAEKYATYVVNRAK